MEVGINQLSFTFSDKTFCFVSSCLTEMWQWHQEYEKLKEEMTEVMKKLNQKSESSKQDKKDPSLQVEELLTFLSKKYLQVGL